MYSERIFPFVGAIQHTQFDVTPAAFLLDAAIGKQAKIKRLLVVIVTVTVGACVLSFRKRPTIGSSTGETVIGTLTIPGGTAVSKVVYKDITPAIFVPGNALAIHITTAGTSGQFSPTFEFDEDPETAANQTNMIASA